MRRTLLLVATMLLAVLVIGGVAPAPSRQSWPAAARALGHLGEEQRGLEVGTDTPFDGVQN
jgi:hypothetical protein